MATIPNVPFPEVRRALRRAIEERRVAGKPSASVTKLAKDLRVSRPTFYAWLNGMQAPSPDRVEGIARLFYSDKSQQERFAKELLVARQVRDVARDRLDRIVLEAEPLNIGVVPYGPFAQVPPRAPIGRPPTGFMDAFFQRFAAYAGLGLGAGMEALDLEKLEHDLASEKRLHVALGVLATVDRALKLKFLVSPIKISLNAVVPVQYIARRADVHAIEDALSLDPKLTKPTPILPVVFPTEVGGIYIARTLGFATQSRPHVKIASYEVGNYVNALLENAGRKIPAVAVADEYMCIRIVEELRGEGTNVFPWCPSTSTRHESWLPTYRLSLALDREDRRWVEFMTEGLQVFLDADTEAIVALYLKLFHELQDVCSDAIKWSAAKRPKADGTNVDEWIRRILGLEKERRASIVAPQWSDILDRVDDQLPKRKSTSASS